MAILVDEKKLEDLLWDFSCQALGWPNEISVGQLIAELIENCKKSS